MKHTAILFAMMAALWSPSSVLGASLEIEVEGGGTPIVFDIGNGQLLGLIGVSGVAIGDSLTEEDILAEVVSGTVLDVFFAENTAFNGDNLPLTAFDSTIIDSLDRASDGRIFDSLFVAFDASAPLVFAGTATLANTVTQTGNPLTPVPVPMAAWLFGAAIMLGSFLRRGGRRLSDRGVIGSGLGAEAR